MKAYWIGEIITNGKCMVFILFELDSFCSNSIEKENNEFELNWTLCSLQFKPPDSATNVFKSRNDDKEGLMHRLKVNSLTGRPSHNILIWSLIRGKIYYKSFFNFLYFQFKSFLCAIYLFIVSPTLSSAPSTFLRDSRIICEFQHWL